MKVSHVIAAAFCLASSAAWANPDYATGLQRLADDMGGWVHEPQLVDAIRQQNTRTAGLVEDEILALDAKWRDQVVSGGAFVNEVMENALSAFLREVKMQAQGQFTEIFVTDARGLNVGQSDLTSDYWQGDEAKWQVPYDTRAPWFGEIEFDESSQTYQSQIALPVLEAGEMIGVVVVGIDVQTLAAAD